MPVVVVREWVRWWGLAWEDGRALGGVSVVW